VQSVFNGEQIKKEQTLPVKVFTLVIARKEHMTLLHSQLVVLSTEIAIKEYQLSKMLKLLV
jgi:hypothetical protein